jgi:hypothetical protein
MESDGSEERRGPSRNPPQPRDSDNAAQDRARAASAEEREGANSRSWPAANSASGAEDCLDLRRKQRPARQGRRSNGWCAKSLAWCGVFLRCFGSRVTQLNESAENGEGARVKTRMRSQFRLRIRALLRAVLKTGQGSWLVRQQNAVDNVYHPVRLVNVGDGHSGHAALFVSQHDLSAHRGRGKRIAGDRL